MQTLRNESNDTEKHEKVIKTQYHLTRLWYHGVNMTPGLFDRLNIPNFEIISFHLALYFLCRFLSTVSIHSILILMLPFCIFYILFV